MNTNQNRRSFLKSGMMLVCTPFTSILSHNKILTVKKSKPTLSAHLWVYASKYPPDWNCTPILDQVFTDIKAAGYDGLELMNVLLEADDSVERILGLIKKHNLPVTGCSYSGDMWKKDKHDQICANATKIIDRLHQVGGRNFGVSVGDARRMKTPEELDAQAALLKKLILYCESKEILLNIHNHTYEVINGMHDLKGTLLRVPRLKLGPDLNWLIRGGIDPVWFIKTYQKQIVYMHLRDQKANGKWAEALGEGSTDFKSIAATLKQLDYQGDAAIELAFDEPATRPVVESWRKSRDYVRRIFEW
jgi:sugar phosphate isomerase/epimerase